LPAGVAGPPLRSMQLTFNNRKALVTGAGRGIGKAVADSLAKAGVHVICVSQNPASCGAAAEAIKETGGSAEAHAVDVSDAAAVEALGAELIKAHGVIDILVNNAGITRDTLIMRMKTEDWEQVLQTNLNSCFFWAKAIMQPMARQRWGRVINMSSVIGLMGNAGQANYAAAKAGIFGLSKSLAREYAKRSVTVNAVAPGFIQTDMTDVLNEATKEAIVAQIPLKRLGTVDDIANCVTFLASEEAGYITGQTFTVDGGMVM
jgi:3-oxoacyl-[acyl-carrier protein] reductase